MPYHLLFPLLSSLLYVGAALSMKRAVEQGAGVWLTNVATNAATFLFFLPLLCFSAAGEGPTAWGQPALVGLLLLGGQALAIWALSRGDVSVATPVLGVKTVLVALFVTLLLDQHLRPALWGGAILSALAIGLLQRGGSKRHHHVGFSIVVGIAAAACFALFDVCVQKWSVLWGHGRFLSLVGGLSLVYSVFLTPVFGRAALAAPRHATGWLVAGVLLMALQSLFLITTVAVFGDATAVNIVYSSRGLWSVAAVWLVGHWFGNQERHLGRSVMAWRLLGAALMTAAIVLALLG